MGQEKSTCVSHAYGSHTLSRFINPTRTWYFSNYPYSSQSHKAFAGTTKLRKVFIRSVGICQHGTTKNQCKFITGHTDSSILLCDFDAPRVSFKIQLIRAPYSMSSRPQGRSITRRTTVRGKRRWFAGDLPKPRHIMFGADLGTN